MKALKKKEITTDLNEFVSDLVFEYKINRKKLPLVSFLNEIKGFLVSNGVTNAEEIDLLMRIAIKENHYAIENYLIETYKRDTTKQFMEAKDVVKTDRKVEAVYGKSEYKDRLKKRFPRIKDSDSESLIMAQDDIDNDDGEMLNEGPFVPGERGSEIPKEWERLLQSTSVGDLPDTISWAIGSYVKAPASMYSICDDCPPIYKNEYDCCYKRQINSATKEPTTKCIKHCKTQPPKKK